MLAENASIIERLLAPLRDAIAATPKVATNGDANRLALMDVKVQDLRNMTRSDAFARGRSHGTRPIASVTALGLHQTASGHIGPGHPRLLGVPAGAMVHQDGTVTLLHDFAALVWHGHAINRFSWGIEFDCREPGIAGLERTFWRTEDERKTGQKMADLVIPLTGAQVRAGCTLCAWAAFELLKRGGKLRGIVAHRQGHKSRSSDPGSRIWQEVAEPMREELLLEDMSHRKWGSGTLLPDVWTGIDRGVSYS